VVIVVAGAGADGDVLDREVTAVEPWVPQLIGLLVRVLGR
jgi:hypothetical protein